MMVMVVMMVAGMRVMLQMAMLFVAMLALRLKFQGSMADAMLFEFFSNFMF